MMKAILILMVLALLFLPVTCFAKKETVVLTQEQYDNGYWIGEYLYDKYPGFKGMHGSREKMKFKGITKDELETELITLDSQAIADIISNHPSVLLEQSLYNKLLGLGLTADEIDLLGVRSWNVSP